jgi:hypothetical protein
LESIIELLDIRIFPLHSSPTTATRWRESLEPDPLAQRIAKGFKNDAGMLSSQPCNAKAIFILDHVAIACMFL